jgi:hypothetical protein
MKIAPKCNNGLATSTIILGQPFKPERQTISKKKLQKAIAIDPRKNKRLIRFFVFLKRTKSPAGTDVMGIKKVANVKIYGLKDALCPVNRVEIS